MHCLQSLKWFVLVTRISRAEDMDVINLFRVDPLEGIFKAREKDNMHEKDILGHLYNRAVTSFENGEDKESELFRYATATGEPRAQYELGVLYAKGKGGIEQSDAEALRWWTRASKQGDMSSQYSLAVMHHSGRASLRQDENDAEAFKFMRLAAEQGHVKAQLNLGWMFYTGRGVEKSGKKAAKWFEKAAAQGLAFAQYELSLCYKRGVGVPQSDEWGKIWFTKATQQGIPLDKLRSHSTYKAARFAALPDVEEAIPEEQEVASFSQEINAGSPDRVPGEKNTKSWKKYKKKQKFENRGTLKKAGLNSSSDLPAWKTQQVERESTQPRRKKSKTDFLIQKLMRESREEKYD